MITKYDSYHTKIEKKLETIIKDEGFCGDGKQSKAFGVWFLENNSSLSRQSINEALIDGNDDHGIDAYIYTGKKEKTLELFQFKFPAPKNVNKEITQDAILKLFNGIDSLIDVNGQEETSKNVDFNELLQFIKDTEVYNIHINFVTYNAGIVDEKNRKLVEQHIQSLKNKINVTYSVFNVDDIINLFDKMQRTNSVRLSLGYVNMQAAYSVDGDKPIGSWVGVVQAKKFISEIHSSLIVIFDENIRLFEKDSSVNEKIKQTAKDKRTSNMFYFYNNGITIICDSAKNSPGTSSLILTGASIVNGCQTVTALVSDYDNGNLQEDVHVLVRVIEIKTYDERALITQYLNSQNPVKESYFFANNHIIRELQAQLLKKGYFLERQINEQAYQRQYGDGNYADTEKMTVLKLEDTIQHYVGAYNNADAAQAKRGKGALFDRDTIEDRLKGITADRVIENEKTYAEISRVITKYRKNRRNSENHDFADFLGIDLAEYNSDPRLQ